MRRIGDALSECGQQATRTLLIVLPTIVSVLGRISVYQCERFTVFLLNEAMSKDRVKRPGFFALVNSTESETRF